MYTPLAFIIREGGAAGDGDYAFEVIRVIWKYVLRTAKTIGVWIVNFAPSLDWAFYSCYDIVHKYPQIFHILFWSLFFGPIIILLPCLLVIELTTLILFNLSFVSHGLVFPAPLYERYDYLRETFLDTREKLFLVVEASGHIYNKWTTEHLALMGLRLVSGVLGLAILVGLWNGW